MKFFQLVKEILNNRQLVIVAGIHGDEPAGNVAAEFFKGKPNITVFSHINKTKERRYDGKDVNRHFDTEDESKLQEDILTKIEYLKPQIVISLHEDNEVNGVYAYCSKDIEHLVKQSISGLNVKIMSQAHKDKTNKGVITSGKQPYKGTLERALKRRNISFCTLETPSSKMDVQQRADILIKITKRLLTLCAH